MTKVYIYFEDFFYFQSDASGSSGSSVLNVLGARKVDAESVLLALGFGPSEKQQKLQRIPDRFLVPSKVSVTFFLLFSFSLYHAHCKVDRRNLVFCFPTFHQIFEILLSEWRNSMPHTLPSYQSELNLQPSYLHSYAVH